MRMCLEYKSSESTCVTRASWRVSHVTEIYDSQERTKEVRRTPPDEKPPGKIISGYNKSSLFYSRNLVKILKYESYVFILGNTNDFMSENNILL